MRCADDDDPDSSKPLFPSDRLFPLFHPISLEAVNPLVHAELAVAEQLSIATQHRAALEADPLAGELPVSGEWSAVFGDRGNR
jgi:hypothetical protein